MSKESLDFCPECHRIYDDGSTDVVERVLDMLNLDWSEVFSAVATVHVARGAAEKFRAAASLSQNGGGNWFQLIHRLNEAADLVDTLSAMLVIERHLSDRLNDALRDEFHNRGDSYAAPMAMAVHTLTRQGSNTTPRNGGER